MINATTTFVAPAVPSDAAAALVEAGRVMALDEEWLDEAREWCANVARGNGRG